jgi:hypothetical protein
MLLLGDVIALEMKRTSSLLLALSFLLLWTAVALGQSASAPAAASAAQYSVQGRGSAADPPQGVPVSYASVTELNGILAQVETTSKDTQADLVNLRIERWKTDNSYKKQTLTNMDSIQRNLQDALPRIILQLRAAPEDLPATFKLYRNLDALYDVLGSVAESAGAFGSKDDFQSLSNDLNGFENARKQLAQRLENLSSSKEAELVRLRADLKAAQAANPVTPPKKVVVDDNEPPKKPPAPAKKKPAAKPATVAPSSQTPAKPTPATPKPSAGQTQTPPAQQATPAQQVPTKPQ